MKKRVSVILITLFVLLLGACNTEVDNFSQGNATSESETSLSNDALAENSNSDANKDQSILSDSNSSLAESINVSKVDTISKTESTVERTNADAATLQKINDTVLNNGKMTLVRWTNGNNFDVKIIEDENLIKELQTYHISYIEMRPATENEFVSINCEYWVVSKLGWVLGITSKVGYGTMGKKISYEGNKTVIRPDSLAFVRVLCDKYFDNPNPKTMEQVKSEALKTGKMTIVRQYDESNFDIQIISNTDEKDKLNKYRSNLVSNGSDSNQVRTYRALVVYEDGAIIGIDDQMLGNGNDVIIPVDMYIYVMQLCRKYFYN